MLKGTPSLALRAALIFMSIYVAVFTAFVATVVFSRALDLGDDPYAGAGIALRYARAELREVDGALALPPDGSFADLAARNPNLWLIARSGDRMATFGSVPRDARRAFETYRDTLDSGRFRVPGMPGELANARLERRVEDGMPLLLAAGGVGLATLSPLDRLSQLKSGVFVGLAVIGALGLAAMIVALPLFARAVRPIAAEADAVVPQDPRHRLDERKAPRELLPLVRAFNSTLDRLAAELARRKRFITDVAHELRTPLAVVSLRVEALEDEGARQDLRRGVGRLTHLVTQMLDLERLSLFDQQKRPVDLVATARDVLADLAPMAIKAGYDVSLDAPDAPVMVVGDEHAIARALNNLIANSVAHGGGAGNIRVAVDASGAIDVADTGPGVDPALLPELFEPFSRGRANVEGCGLGLHLTREIMRAHGGEVRLLPSSGGARFRLDFGAASAADGVQTALPGRG